MKITIGITTFNRPEYLQRMKKSLYASKGLDACHLRIYDDCSPHWGVDFLKKLFPDAVEIIRREKNLGSDHNIRQMFIDFLKTDDDVLISIDSDLIFHSDWLSILKKGLPFTDGVLSVYNSSLHESKGRVDLDGCDVSFVEKPHIGSAGAAFTKAIMQDIIDNVPISRTYDWDWSEYLIQKNKRLFVTEKSFVQHIGIDGYNNKNYLTDFGMNFEIDNKINEKIFIDFFENLVKEKDRVIADNLIVEYERIIKENLNTVQRQDEYIKALRSSYTYKIGSFLTYPVRLLKRLMK